MQKHKREQGKILENVPDDRGVTALPALDFVGGNEEPRPVEEYIDSGKTEEMDGTTASTEHLLRLLDQTDPTEVLPLKAEKRQAGTLESIYISVHPGLSCLRHSGLTENLSGNIAWPSQYLAG
jgi:hypothetical protein